VFATTAQEVLGSCIFLFVKHPYDVGDRVDINGQALTVEHISLLYTAFKEVTTHRTTQAPNIVLNTLWVDNVSRSNAMREQLLIYISFDTTLEDIQLLRNEMQAFVLDKENSRDFLPEIDVELTGINNMDKMELKVEIRHKSNWANETVRAARRSKFMCALVLALRKVPIYPPGGGGAALGSSDQPTYSVTVSDEEAAARRAAFDKAKEEKRLIPSPQPDDLMAKGSYSKGSSSGTDARNESSSLFNRNLPPLNTTTSNQSSAVEKAAVDTLNARAPAADPARDIDWQSNSTLGDQPTPPSDNDDRGGDIEEVRGLLNRQSTRGKRKPIPQGGRPLPGVPANAQNTALSSRAPRVDVDFHDYAPSIGSQSPAYSQGSPRRPSTSDGRSGSPAGYPSNSQRPSQAQNPWNNQRPPPRRPVQEYNQLEAQLREQQQRSLNTRN